LVATIATPNCRGYGNDDALVTANGARVTTTSFGQRLLLDIGNGTHTTTLTTRRTGGSPIWGPRWRVGYNFHDLAFKYDPIGNLTILENKALPPAPSPGNAIGGP
jgi:hypothetical protein